MGTPHLPESTHETTAQPRRWSVARTIGLIALLICIAGAGAGSVILSSNNNRPTVAHQQTIGFAGHQRVITQTQPVAPSGQSASGTGSTTRSPDTCNCTGTRLAVTTAPLPPGGAPNIGGQVMLVSLSRQWMWAFENGTLVYSTPVTTGQPDLATPTGIFSISEKIAGTWFISPWPQGSPYYYSPVYVNYAMLFLDGGYFIHDAPWRHYFGPGTNVPHTNPDGTHETGSHGCVEVSTAAGAWLYSWAAYGATVDIVS